MKIGGSKDAILTLDSAIHFMLSPAERKELKGARPQSRSQSS
jgi:hypothetical protein